MPAPSLRIYLVLFVLITCIFTDEIVSLAASSSKYAGEIIVASPKAQGPSVYLLLLDLKMDSTFESLALHFLTAKKKNISVMVNSLMKMRIGTLVLSIVGNLCSKLILKALCLAEMVCCMSVQWISFANFGLAACPYHIVPARL